MSDILNVQAQAAELIGARDARIVELERRMSDQAVSFENMAAEAAEMRRYIDELHRQNEWLRDRNRELLDQIARIEATGDHVALARVSLHEIRDTAERLIAVIPEMRAP